MFVRRRWLQEGRQMSKFRAESWVAYLNMRFMQRSVYLNCRWPHEAALNISLSSRTIYDSVYLSVCPSGYFYLLLFLHFCLHVANVLDLFQLTWMSKYLLTAHCPPCCVVCFCLSRSFCFLPENKSMIERQVIKLVREQREECFCPA